MGTDASVALSDERKICWPPDGAARLICTLPVAVEEVRIVDGVTATVMVLLYMAVTVTVAGALG